MLVKIREILKIVFLYWFLRINRKIFRFQFQQHLLFVFTVCNPRTSWSVCSHPQRVTLALVTLCWLKQTEKLIMMLRCNYYGARGGWFFVVLSSLYGVCFVNFFGVLFFDALNLQLLRLKVYSNFFYWNFPSTVGKVVVVMVSQCVLNPVWFTSKIIWKSNQMKLNGCV